ncbi:aldo/keto reductase [Deinococcus cellulosilyticus]|uniref:Aldo/keto reductase n=1 Tax=Deinococcus cellulosilyticus (strain DSM 18568 / NBRC 106333 / KACC 11606 / 5516J-15) TaxID=1223518 RepID=A0A511MYE4_DEIC1|nr:aldo/keto reductase [Deinococcus cellulosilyticus]GEM45157.1 aldo/keto reductase [Deinococcus cellulosilyticus NBRC 106333 = KACC 11606]
MTTRKLGPLEVSPLGLGCMGMSQSYGTTDDAESIRTLDYALDHGINFLDTADVYGPHTNEELLGRYLQGKRDKVVLATKFGIHRTPTEYFGINGKPEYVKQAIEGSLKRLQTDFIDLYYLHRVDPNTPIEDTVGALAELVQAGLVRYIGLSEVSPGTLRRAHAVHPITAVQSEYSLWTRDPEDGLLSTLRELGVGLVAYSPLGRGFLTGAFKTPDDFEPTDNRRNHPRFQGENFYKNLDLASRIQDFAHEKGATPAQVALAWVLSQGQDIVPIPGTKRVKYLQDNLGSLNVQLTHEELAQLDRIAPLGIAAGDRYPDMSAINR